jgi:putative membrane protein
MSSDHRLHPYSILFAFLSQFRLFIVPGILVYFGVGSRDSDWWEPWMMLFVLPAAGLAVLRYYTYRFRFEASELVIHTGLLFRKERHIPYARIQNIDAVQNVLHRLLNVVEIKIETGGGDTAEATMSVLPASALPEMRQRVFAGRRAEAQEDHGERAESPSLLQLDLRELLLCGFIENRGAVLIAAASGVLWELGILDRVLGAVIGPVSIGRGTIRNLFRGVFPAVAVSWAGIAMTVTAIAGIIVLIRLFSMAWAVMRLYGFTLSIVDEDVRTRFGLLTRVAMTIPLRRIQTVTVRETLLHRYFERVAVKVDTAGGRVGEQNQHQEREYLAPILRRPALDDFTRAIAGVTFSGVDWHPPHPRAFRREVKGWLAPVAVLAVILGLSLGWRAVPIVLRATAWAIVGARQSVRNLGWALTSDAVMLKRGWLSRRLVVVRFAKIQTVTRHENPFDRRTHMARIHVDTAGAAEGSVINIPYVAREDADALYARLAEAAAERQFRW